MRPPCIPLATIVILAPIKPLIINLTFAEFWQLAVAEQKAKPIDRIIRVQTVTTNCQKYLRYRKP